MKTVTRSRRLRTAMASASARDSLTGWCHHARSSPAALMVGRRLGRAAVGQLLPASMRAGARGASPCSQSRCQIVCPHAGWAAAGRRGRSTVKALYSAASSSENAHRPAVEHDVVQGEEPTCSSPAQSQRGCARSGPRVRSGAVRFRERSSAPRLLVRPAAALRDRHCSALVRRPRQRAEPADRRASRNWFAMPRVVTRSHSGSARTRRGRAALSIAWLWERCRRRCRAPIDRETTAAAARTMWEDECCVGRFDIHHQRVTFPAPGRSTSAARPAMVGVSNRQPSDTC